MCHAAASLALVAPPPLFFVLLTLPSFLASSPLPPHSHQVAIEEMVERVAMLDPYSRPILAPLGIVFPFPLFCSKLDSYMKLESEIAAKLAAGKHMLHVLYVLLLRPCSSGERRTLPCQ